MGLIVDGVEPRIRELLAAYPSMPATVIAERVGWDRSIRVLSSRQRGDPSAALFTIASSVTILFPPNAHRAASPPARPNFKESLPDA